MISNKTQITVTAITTKNIGNSFESKRIKIKHIVTAGLYVHVCGIMCTACYIYNRDGMILYWYIAILWYVKAVIQYRYKFSYIDIHIEYRDISMYQH